MFSGRRVVLLAVVGGVFLALVTVAGAAAVTLAPAGSARIAGGSAPTTLTVPPVVAVPPLRTLTPPDVIVTVRRPASPAAVAKLRAVSGVHAVAVADRGHVRVGGARLRVIGVPLADIRGFTPQVTAQSDPLWRSVARGEITVSYADNRRLQHRLGATLLARGDGGAVAPLRIGAFATIGLAGTQALVAHSVAGSLGLAPRRELLVAAPTVSLDSLRADVKDDFGATASVVVTRATPVDQSVLSSYAQATIPATYLDLYRRAAVTCPGLPWTVLAGIGTVETGNGRDVHRSTAGAEGPMQFLPSTWARYGYDADGDGKANINDPVDAVFSAARYLCAAGAGRGGQSLDTAIYAYNHAWWYVREVVVIANRYA
jgi:Transglycosylase SLT domain